MQSGDDSLVKTLLEPMYFDFCGMFMGMISSSSSCVHKENGTVNKIKFEMKNLVFKLFLDMQEIGVDLNMLTLDTVEDGAVQISFDWKYHRAQYPQQRKLTYVSADITAPKAYLLFCKNNWMKG